MRVKCRVRAQSTPVLCRGFSCPSNQEWLSNTKAKAQERPNEGLVGDA